MKERVAQRVGTKDVSSIQFKYLHNKEPYKLEDSDDYEIFLERHTDASDVDVYLDVPDAGVDAVPVAPPTSYVAPSISYAGLAPPKSSSPNVPVLNESTLVTRTPAAHGGC